MNLGPSRHDKETETWRFDPKPQGSIKMAIRWLVSIPKYNSAFFAASFSAWQAGYHAQHISQPSSEIGAYQMLGLAEAHGYFSILVNEKLALKNDPNTNVPGIVHALMALAPNPAAGTRVTDTDTGLVASALHKTPPFTNTFPLTITLLKEDGQSTATVGSVYFQGVKVTGFLPVQDGYIFSFMVTGKFREAF
jgi:hypothetical protein